MSDYYPRNGCMRIEPTENGWVLFVHEGRLGSEARQWVATSAAELALLVKQWAVNTLGERPVYPQPGAKPDER